jgi:predicted NUDIX family NTP pyrophosphohydrolase
MAVKSAGILLYRFRNNRPEFLLAHPGGPFWAKKDDGVWSIPKGEFDVEEPLVAAIREFQEETGAALAGDFMPLSLVKSKSGKILYPFAIEHDFDILELKSNTFTMEWPPKSGMQRAFPEVDRAQWFDFETSKVKALGYQVSIIEELMKKLRDTGKG